MTRFIRLISYTVCLVLLINICNAQKKYLHSKPKLTSYLNIDSIASIEILDSWTNERWILDSTNLKKVKMILRKSSVNTLMLKPSHLYIKIKGSNDFNKYSTYMYNNEIFFEPVLDPKTLEPFRNTKEFSIWLFKPIDWVSLKNNTKINKIE